MNWKGQEKTADHKRYLPLIVGFAQSPETRRNIGATEAMISRNRTGPARFSVTMRWGRACHTPKNHWWANCNQSQIKENNAMMFHRKTESVRR